MDNLIKEINSIHDNTDLRILRDVINDRIKALSYNIKYSLNRGDLVSITTRGKTETGTIDKVNRTRAVVNINGKLWNVPFSLMTIIKERETNE
jgi:hypothetical protein